MKPPSCINAFLHVFPPPLAEDQLIRDLKASAAQIAPALVDLEIEGQIQRQSGGMVSLSGNEHKDHKGH